MSFSIKQSHDVKVTTEPEEENTEYIPFNEPVETEYEKYVNNKKNPKDLFSTSYSSFLAKEKTIKKRSRTPAKKKKTGTGLRMFPTQTGQSDFF